MVLTVVTVAFKLFPIFVWKDRFQPEYGKSPVPGMKDLPSHGLRVGANLATFMGSLGTAAAIFVGHAGALTASTLILAAGIAAFVVNLALVLRWSFWD
jgi:hypothetical protein